MHTHYQRVATRDDDATNRDIPLHDRIDRPEEPTPASPPSPSSSGAHIGELPRRPSVYRLLPYFFLSSLAWGITMVPKVNVLVSLICQHMVSSGAIGDPAGSPRYKIPPDMRDHDASTMGGQNMTVGSSLSMDSSGVCSSPEVLANVAFMSTYRDLVTGIIAAAMSYYLGKLSDRIGRVKVMALNGHGILAGELVVLLVVAFPQKLDYRWLFLSFVIDGLSGSSPLLMATTSSYVTDTTTDKDRVVAMGWIQSGMFLGMAAGPALGTALSRLSGDDKPAAIFLYAVICRVIGLLCLLALPESLPTTVVNKNAASTAPRKRQSPRGALTAFVKSTFSLGAVDTLFDPHASPAEVRLHRRNLLLFIAITGVMLGTSMGAMDVMMLYPQAKFQWDMMATGNFISVINICRMVSTMVILRLLMRLFNRCFSRGFFAKASTESEPDLHVEEHSSIQEIKHAHLPLLRISLCSDILGYLGFGLAPSGLLFVVSGILSSLSAMGLSASQASMSMLVAPEHVGKLMGIVGYVQALTRLTSPPIVNLIYGWTVSTLPQGVFFGIAAAVGAGLVMTYLIRLF